MPPLEETALAVDAASKEYTAKPGEESHVFTFTVKNVSQADVIINHVSTSCGCTVATLPAQPWRVAPGKGGDIQLVVDLRGKSGSLVKTATIETATAYKLLTIKVTLPNVAGVAGMDSVRERNRQLAAKNRQAVFQGDCARCHVTPAVDKTGVALYVTACSICHDAEHRGTMVPDLHAIKGPTDREFWRTQIALGKPGSLMPAFAQDQGGPLTSAQIDSLAEYLAGEFSGREAPSPAK